MDVSPTWDVHFKESVYELHKRESHGFSPSVSHRLDYEVSLQGAGRRVAGADTNDYPAGVQRTGRPDRIRRFVASARAGSAQRAARRKLVWSQITSPRARATTSAEETNLVSSINAAATPYC